MVIDLNTVDFDFRFIVVVFVCFFVQKDARIFSGVLGVTLTGLCESMTLRGFRSDSCRILGVYDSGRI